MSNEFSGSKPDEGAEPSKSVKEPIKVIGLIVGIAIIGCAVLVYWVATSRQATADEPVTPVSLQPKVESYSKSYPVGIQPVRIDIPFGYRFECMWGEAPLETRSSDKTEWVPVDTNHIVWGNTEHWREWRLDQEYVKKYGGGREAKVLYKFTKVF